MNSIHINGHSISTSKGGVSVSNNIVQCSDGSWFDLSTGQGENCGPGFLIVDGRNIESHSAAPTMVKPKSPVRETFQGVTKLIVEAQTSVVILGESGRQEVEVVSQDEAIEQTSPVQKGSVLHVSQSSKRNRKGFLNIGNISAGNVNIGFSQSNQKDTLSIKVPIGMHVELTSHNQAEIIGTQGPLLVNLAGNDDVHASDIVHLSVNAMGNGDVDVRNVRGEAHLTSSSNGDITVHGSLSNLVAHANGNGDIMVHGHIEKAEGFTNGNGDVIATGVVSASRIRSKGNGDVRMTSPTGHSW